ncbi:solute carrier family 25 member 36-like [Oscarella lobularis]|uniref:solute carrier family 25 member 36-like n=1 Tax=Oscarella lobularis TaxID=121494 RepID=UPI003313AE65
MSRNDKKSTVHLFAGGVAGAVAATATAPLEVVKTRLQSSVVAFQPVHAPVLATSAGPVTTPATSALARPGNTLACLRRIVATEGTRSLFKGLGPTLVGIAPSRAIYFACYNHFKSYYNAVFEPNTAPVHLSAAVSAGVTACTITNPIWVIRTHLQLDPTTKESFRYSAVKCVKDVWRREGLRGFYRGLTASYAGTSETAIYFVLYERFKENLRKQGLLENSQSTTSTDVIQYMIASACAKLTATVIAYPHEVARTRLRQNDGANRRYHSLIQTLVRVWREEGRHGLYGGLGTHLIRVIPNSAILFATFETIVRFSAAWSD